MKADPRAVPPAAVTLQRWLIDLFVLGVAVQFFLAGLGVFATTRHPARLLADGSAFDAHRTVGNILIVVSVVILGSGIAARRQVPAAAVLLLLTGLQSVWTHAGRGTPAVGAIHVLGAFAITILAFTMHRTSHASKAPPREPATRHIHGSVRSER
jgi:sterol desaturase/sphingolipid hydroxylase (fatty acid hydroxylase superfamily)